MSEPDIRLKTDIAPDTRLSAIIARVEQMSRQTTDIHGIVVNHLTRLLGSSGVNGAERGDLPDADHPDGEIAQLEVTIDRLQTQLVDLENHVLRLGEI